MMKRTEANSRSSLQNSGGAEEEKTVEAQPYRQEAECLSDQQPQDPRTFPKEFYCPVKKERMIKPTVALPSGITYERSVLKEAIKKDKLDPLTGERLTKIFPNKLMEALIETYLKNLLRLPPHIQKRHEIADVFPGECLLCPITKEIMRDPVIGIPFYFTYEYTNLVKALSQDGLDPKTSGKLEKIVSNTIMKALIDRLTHEGLIEKILEKLREAHVKESQRQAAFLASLRSPIAQKRVAIKRVKTPSSALIEKQTGSSGDQELAAQVTETLLISIPPEINLTGPADAQAREEKEAPPTVQQNSLKTAQQQHQQLVNQQTYLSVPKNNPPRRNPYPSRKKQVPAPQQASAFFHNPPEQENQNANRRNRFSPRKLQNPTPHQTFALHHPPEQENQGRKKEPTKLNPFAKEFSM
ncbi:MAG: U-box domain [Gammaproteobacteria bacterium]|jgi:hypothetical protein|nr:U-box domain [Gammaproteobacteria bacterium]